MPRAAATLCRALHTPRTVAGTITLLHNER